MGWIMKRLLVILVLIVFILPFYQFSKDKTVHFKIPVRLMKDRLSEPDLKKEDFQLFINGRPREIIRFQKITRSLTEQSQLGKNYILSFHNTEYTQLISDGINYFVSQILNPEDSLLLMTAMQIYQIKVSKNKVKIIRDIEDLVKKDSLTYKSSRVLSEENLEAELKKINRVLRQHNVLEVQTTDDRTPTLFILRFLDHYTREFVNFKKHYLLPDSGKFKELTDLLDGRDGEKWWVHFQQTNIYPSQSLLRKTQDRIRDHVSALALSANWARMISTKLSTLEKKIMLGDSYPATQLYNLTARQNICYNVLFFKNYLKKDSSENYTTPSDLENILETISKTSGGKTSHTTNIEDGLKEIADHQDSFYELTYKFDNHIERKLLKVNIPGKKFKPSYKSSYTEKEIDSLVKLISRGKVKVDGFTQKKNRLAFTVKNFRTLKKDDTKFGLLRVQIKLKDLQDTDVYTSEKLVRSLKEEFNISLSLPSIHKGDFKLIITIFDLLANNFSSFLNAISL
jgi:hypothetical protein